MPILDEFLAIVDAEDQAVQAPPTFDDYGRQLEAEVYDNSRASGGGMTGVFGDVGRGVASGLTRGVRGMAAAAEWFAPEGSPVEDSARGMKEDIDAGLKHNPAVFAESKRSGEARDDSPWNTRGWLYGGFESLGRLAPGIATGVVTANPLVGPAVTMGQFWGDTAQDSYDKSKGLTEPEKITLANLKGFSEGGLEAVQMFFPLKLAKMLPKSLSGKVVKTIAGANRKPLLDVGKDVLKTISAEVPFELLQEASGMTADYAYNQRQNLPSFKDIAPVIGPTIIMSALLGTGASIGANSQRKAIHRALTDENVPVELRLQAVDVVENELRSRDAELADLWMKTARPQAAKGPVAIPLDDEIRNVQPDQSAGGGMAPSQQTEIPVEDSLDIQKSEGVDAPVQAAESVPVQEQPKPTGPLSKAVAKGMAPQAASVQEVEQSIPEQAVESAPGETIDDMQVDPEQSLNEESLYGSLPEVRQETGGTEEVPPVRGENEVLESPVLDNQPVTQVDVLAHEAATSPVNDIPEPTEGQIKAGNYKKGHVKLHGMDISIENPWGSVRKGVDADGREWETPIVHSYGYIKGTVGHDKDHLDVFLGPHAETAETAYVIDQKNKDGSFDEHKVVIGAQDEQDALDVYNANYEQGWDGAGAVTALPMDEFKAWAKSEAPGKGALTYKEVKNGKTTDTTTERTEKGATERNGTTQQDGQLPEEVTAVSGVDVHYDNEQPTPDEQLRGLEALAKSAASFLQFFQHVAKNAESGEPSSFGFSASAPSFREAIKAENGAEGKAALLALYTKARAKEKEQPEIDRAAEFVAEAKKKKVSALALRKRAAKVGLKISSKLDGGGHVVTETETGYEQRVADLVEAEKVVAERETKSVASQEPGEVSGKGEKQTEVVAEEALKEATAGKSEGVSDGGKLIDDQPGREIADEVGESLGGSRRELESMRESVEKELTDDYIANNPLSKIWPKKEVDDIEDPFLAAIATVVRGSIPSKPRTKDKVSRWTMRVKEARALYSALISSIKSGSIDRAVVIRKMKTGYDLSSLAAKIELLSMIDRSNWSRIDHVYESPDAVRLDRDGKKGKPYPHIMVRIDGKRHNIEGSGYVESSVDKVKSILDENSGEKKIKFELRGSKRDGFNINKKGDGEYRSLKSFSDRAEAIKYYRDEANYAELAAAWEDVKTRDNVKKTDVRRKDNRPRTGADHRKGEDVTPETFIQTFGFRGVEFGNWVKQGKNSKDRQGMLNQAYDALVDMANILDIPLEAISLNGTLGLGFGSRGSGWASAHYEPGRIVINLTKTRGAGSLGHEFFHALDNYFSLQRGKAEFTGDAEKYRDDSYITHKPEPLYVHKTQTSRPISLAQLQEYRKSHPESEYLKAENWHKDPDHPEGVRPEVEKKFAALVEALNQSPMNKRSKALDKGKAGYWSSTLERAARAFENYLILKMQTQGYDNDYLANVIPADEFSRNSERYPYLLEEEMAPVKEAFDSLFSTIETKKTDKGTALYSVSVDTRIAYRRRISDLFNGKPASNFGVKILDSSDVLDLLGFGGRPVHLVEGKLKDGMKNHNLKEEHWKRLPFWMEDPALVFDSATVPDDLVFIPKETVNGNIVIVSVSPAKNGKGLNVHLTTNAYDKDGSEPPLKRWINEGKLRYYTKKRSAASDRSRLQLPGLSKAKRFDKLKIYRDADLVKYREGEIRNSVSKNATGTTAAQVETEVKNFLGRGYDKLVKAGKLRIVQSVDGETAGVYTPADGVVTLIADNIPKGEAANVFKHEVLHQILREDPIFSKKRDEILKQFTKLRSTSQSVREAYARVPKETTAENIDEEALAYLIQGNPKHILVRRLIAAVKAWLVRHGISLKNLTEADLVALVNQGVRSFADRGDEPSGVSEETPSKFSMAAETDVKRSSALSDVEFDAALSRITAGMVDRKGFVVVKSAEHLPAAILAAAENNGSKPDEIDGVFHRGKVYIVRKHISSVKELESIVFHEWYGHAGLYGMMGNDGVAVRKKMVELYKAMPAGMMLKISKKYGFNLSKYAKGLREARDANGNPLTDAARQAVLMEEMLAFLTEEYSRGSIATKVKEIIGAIREWLRKNGFAKLAALSESDLALLLKQARTHAELGAWSKRGTVVFNGVDVLQRLEEKGITEDRLRQLFSGFAAESEVRYSLNPENDPAVMDRMRSQLYVPEQIYEGTEKIYAEGSKVAAAEEIARGRLRGIETVREISRSGWPEGEYGQLANQVLRPEESKALKVWAEKKGLMLKNDQFDKLWKKGGSEGGTEHDVYYNKSDGRWYKRQRFTMSDTFTDYFQRIALTNHLNNGYAQYRLEGFVENNGELQPVVSQADLPQHGSPVSIQEINSLMDKAGFVRVDKADNEYMGQFRLPGQDYIISDHYKGNVRRLADGSIAFIDPLIKPDLDTKKDRLEASVLAEKYGVGDAMFRLRDQAESEIEEVAKAIKNPKLAMSKGVKNLIRGVSKRTPEKLKGIIGQVAGSPWFSSEGHPFLRKFVLLNLARSDNRNVIINDVAREQDDYLGHEGMGKIVRGLSKKEVGRVYAVIKQGDIEHVEYSADDLKKRGFSEKMADAYRAFRQTIDKANEVKLAELKKLSLLPYENSPFFEELTELVEAGHSQKKTAKLLGVDESLVAAYNTLRGLRADIEKGLAKYKNQPEFDTAVSLLVAGRTYGEVLKEYGLDHKFMKMFKAGISFRVGRKTALSYKKSGFYNQLREFISYPEAYAKYKENFDKNYELLRAYKNVVGYKSKLEEMKKKLRNLKGYAPRTRENGDWLVRVREADPTTGEMPQVFMQTAKTEHGAEMLKDKLEKNRDFLKESLKSNFSEDAHYDFEYIQSDQLDEDVFLNIGTDLAISQLLDKAIGKSNRSPEELAGLRDNVFNLVANDIMSRGFGRHNIGRSKSLIEGYQDDNYLKVLKQYVGGMAGVLSKSEFAIRAQLAIREGDKAATPEQKRWVQAYVTDALRNSNSLDQIGATFRAYAALMMLGGKISTTALNSTQNYILGQAELSRHGVKRPTWAILRAQKDVIALHVGKNKLTAEETELLEQSSRAGRTRAQYAREIFGQDEGIVDGGVSGAVGWLAGKAMIPFQLVETYWNREPMMLAAFREFRKQGMDFDAAKEKAEEIVNNVHFVIGKENRPEMVRKMGAVGTGAYTFQSFTHNYLLWLANRIKAGELDAIARSMTAVVLLGGVIALPGADDLDDWWMEFFGESPQRELRRWLKKHGDEYFDAGDAIEDFVLNGIPALGGVNFSGSLSVRIPFMGADEDTAAERFGGVLPSLLWERPGRALTALSKGDHLRALENAPFTPEFISNPIRAGRYYYRGATTMSGKPIFDNSGKPVKYTASEAMLKIFGFMPIEQSRYSRDRWDTRRVKQYWSDKKSDLLAEYRSAKNHEERKSVFVNIVKFNKRLRSAPGGVLVPPISGKTLKSALRYRPNRREIAYNR